MIIGDVLELTLYQRYLNTVEIRNVLHYQVTAVGTMDESGLSVAFNANVLPLMLDVQHVGVSHYKQTVTNLTDGLGLADVDLIPDQIGVISQDVLPPFVCFAFRKNRTTRATRSGQFRVAGVGEGTQANGIAGATITDDLDQLAAVMSAIIGDSTGGTYDPVIVRKTAAGGVALVNPVANVEFVSVSSQNTRKYGRGI